MFGLCFFCCTFKFLAYVVGIYSVCHILFNLGMFIFRSYIRKPHDLIARYGKDSWVVVTGCTAGLGEQYALDFARRGFNVVLVGRNKENLTKTENYIKDINKNIKVMVIEADLSESIEPEFYQRIYKQINELDISILVNNAGVITVKHFERIPPKEHFDMINTNSGAPVMLTHVLLDKLRNRKSKSAVINIASIAGLSPVPFNGAYPATKKFLSYFSYGLYSLYRDQIDVLNVVPGYIKTKMANFRQGPDTATPKEVVDQTFRSLGYDYEICPHPSHGVFAQVIHTTYKFLRPMWRATVSAEIEKMALQFFYKENEARLKAKKND